MEQDTPIKQHLKETDIHAHPESPHTNESESESWNPFKGLTADEIRSEMLKSISLEKPERGKFSRGTNTLSWTEYKSQPLPSVLPFKVKCFSDDDKAPPEVDAKRMEWLKEINLKKDPYYMTRIEREHGELHSTHIHSGPHFHFRKEMYWLNLIRSSMRLIIWRC